MVLWFSNDSNQRTTFRSTPNFFWPEFQIGRNSKTTNDSKYVVIVKPTIFKFLSMRTLTHYPYLIHLGGIFPKCLGRFYSLVRFYHSKLVNFKQGNIHRLVIFFISLISYLILRHIFVKVKAFFQFFHFKYFVYHLTKSF